MAAGCFSFGPCGCKLQDADIQIAIALLRRVGMGPFTMNLPAANGGPPNLQGLDAQPWVSGPFNPVYIDLGDNYDPNVQHVDPLYLHATSSIEWSDGTSFNSDIMMNPEFMDWTISGNLPTRITAVTNGPIGGWDGFDIMFYFVNFEDFPPQPWPDNWDYAPPPSVNLNGMVTNGGLTYTLSWGDTDIYNPDGSLLVHYVGATITWQLDPTYGMSFEEYADLCDAMLDQITLQDGTLAPNKTYSVPVPGVIGGVAAKFRYTCEFPGPTDPTLYQYTSTLIVSKNRSGFVFGTIGSEVLPTQFFNPPGMGLFSWAWTGLPCNKNTSQLVPGTGYYLNQPYGRYPLAAHGMPFGVIAVPGGGLEGDGMPGAPALGSAAFIFSAKSSVRSKVDMSKTAQVLQYNPANDALNLIVAAVPVGPGEYILTPGDVGFPGALLALYSIESICSTYTAPAPVWTPEYIGPFIPQGGQPIFMARGASQTFYSVTFDAHGNWCYNRPAKWSLGQPGAGFGAVTPSCLAPSPDGLSAVFTAPNAPGEAILVTAVEGMTFQMNIVVVIF